MALKLKAVLARLKQTQSALARALGVSDALVAQIVNHAAWPKSLNEQELQECIRIYLEKHGATEEEVSGAFDDEVSEPRPNAARPVPKSRNTTESNQEETMLLRKQGLSQAARKHFGLFRDPFQDDIQSHEDMFVSPDIRYVRESMLQTAKHGGMLAVIAESGAGKTTLLRDLDDRIAREGLPIIMIRPYVLAMEDNDQKGKTLKATHIAEAIMAAVAPLQRPKSSPEARFAQLHKALRDSHAAGYRHCLVIDEAHSLPIPTIKHLKRFIELEAGFKKLLSIILIGQPELKTKLSERDAAVREVVQRCEVAELQPLDAVLPEYLAFKLKRQDKTLAEVIDASGVDALRARLTVSTGRPGRESVSLLYPLAVSNLLCAAMNLAAEIGVPVVNADVVRGV